MNYRGVVKKGVVVLEPDSLLPDGTVVDVAPVDSAREPLRNHPAFGIWRDREDMSDPVEASRRLRETIERGGSDE